MDTIRKFLFWLIPKNKKSYYRELNQLVKMSDNEIDHIYDALLDCFREQVGYEEDAKHSCGHYPKFVLESDLNEQKLRLKDLEKQSNERITELGNLLVKKQSRIEYLAGILNDNNINY